MINMLQNFTRSTKALLTAGAFLFTLCSAQAQCALDFDIDGGCISLDNGWVAVSNITGATFPATISWNTGDVTAYVSDVANGTYTATVTDAAGCTVSKSVDVDCSDLGGKKDCQLRTQTQGGWGAPPNGNNPGSYVHANFATCFPGGLTIGCTNTLTLTSAQAVTDYLPAGGGSSVLPAGNKVDPVGYKNQLAAQLVAASLSVAFDACDPNFGPAVGYSLGDAQLNTGIFSGWTVQQLIDEANSLIGGCGSTYSANQLKSALDMVNNNYVDGTGNNGNIDCVKKDTPVEKSIAVTSKDNISLFPNPSNGQVNISITSTSDASPQLQILDVTGRVMSATRTLAVNAGVEQIHTFDLSDYTAGVYYARVQLNGSIKAIKFIVKK
jgi:hypothetical protein